MVQEVPDRRKVFSESRSVKADTVIVETNLYEARLSSRGGGTLIGWKLKKYFIGDKKKGVFVDLIPDSAFGNLSLYLGGMGDLSETVFEFAGRSEGEEDGRRFQRIRFLANLPRGGQIERVLEFKDNQYDILLSINFISLGQNEMGDGYHLEWRSGLSHTEEGRISDDMRYYQAYALQGGEMLKTKDKTTGLREGTTNWVAVRTKYFIMAMIPVHSHAWAAELAGTDVKIHDYKGDLADWRRFNVRLNMTAEKEGKYKIYLGPMDYGRLKAMGVGLEKMMNFGMVIIRPFSIAFFYTLQFLYDILGNYGWAIIVFSIMIKIVLYPLTRKSYQSMRAMQELQPKMNALKEKYKKDPQKLNQETMKLYKQHGVNPMGGCLPMILQMPVLFALFNLFRTTIMLRQASFLGLISDLSAPDGIILGVNILPILMAATMIVQQKLATQNPQQKAMAYFMPVFLGYIFYKLSAGLNLYYLMFNVLTIAQEVFIKKKK